MTKKPVKIKRSNPDAIKLKDVIKYAAALEKESNIIVDKLTKLESDKNYIESTQQYTLGELQYHMVKIKTQQTDIQKLINYLVNL